MKNLHFIAVITRTTSINLSDIFVYAELSKQGIFFISRTSLLLLVTDNELAFRRSKAKASLRYSGDKRGSVGNEPAVKLDFSQNVEDL